MGQAAYAVPGPRAHFYVGLAGHDHDHIAAPLAAEAPQVFDQLEPALGDHAVRERPPRPIYGAGH
ncbi:MULTISPECIES: hypothetical protein [Streptomyces]|uniref:hypothetical protein n=1 Tax=Streptomyces TaxID=1883 RepID=UPI003440356D